MSRKQQTRTAGSSFTATREEGGDLRIEGYFARYSSETELWQGAFEEISPGAFDGTLGNDVRALADHDTRFVLGRNKAGTLTLRSDSTGLWASILINQKDMDAMNLHARVERGDISQASFGFNVLEETTDYREDGTIKWTINKIDLHEVSVVAFPAYKDTELYARKEQAEGMRQKRIESAKHQLTTRLEALHSGIKTANEA